RKMTLKKNKTWDGDGVLSLAAGSMLLQDLSGKALRKSSSTSEKVPEVDSELNLGGMTVQIESVISKQDFLAGKPFLRKTVLTTASVVRAIVTAAHEGVESSDAKLSRKAQNALDKLDKLQAKSTTFAEAPPSTRSKFKTPLLSNTVLPKVGPNEAPQPRHDPNAEGALVMKRPTSVPRGKRIVDVVVDPILTKHLRQHQREGVAFLYECVMGMRGALSEGAILADEMGLGKTLQTIALLWTLLKQNPIYEDPPIAKKALIVCPATLIKNWRKEFWKWLGKERLGVFALNTEKGGGSLTDFTKGKAYQIMIIGYERLRTICEDEQLGQAVDIVIMDEGHRLKTETNLCAKAIRSLNTEKRVVLTGTPMQNDLSEYFAMIDLINPGLLGKKPAFQREFEKPILKSQQPDASESDIQKGTGRAKELKVLTDQFILRRTADVIAQFLPQKTEYVLFCKPDGAQAEKYREMVSSNECLMSLENNQASLQLINTLRQLCNSAGPSNVGPSAKLLVLDALLKGIRKTAPNDKVVIVSNYTSTLDMIGRQLSNYGFLRLDGTVAESKRQPIVDEFNKVSVERCFVFLLSARAGGVGLNLIGANRLIMFDADWNPSTDLQAMARIHRDGQERPCYIYRLLLMGGIDEKIFQRQAAKLGLSDSVVDNKTNASSFSRDELRDLFSFDESGVCMTHELLECSCGGLGVPPTSPLSKSATSSEESSTSASSRDGSTESGATESSDDDLPDIGTFITVDKLDVDEQERWIRSHKAKKH
ncbi:hypothetical protein NA57DRAFT_14881, partial [Rhizodiscina lignyota]